jgi:DNA-binding MarR family transcriptional regulator
LYDATVSRWRQKAYPERSAAAFPDDVISSVLRRLVRSGGLLEPHDHAGVHASLSEILALRELIEHPGIAQNELAERLGLEKSTVSRLVAGMEQRGWVSRNRDPANRRYLRLTLTARGDETAHRIGRRLHEHHRILLAGLTPSELDALTVGLTALARVIEHVHTAAAAGHARDHRPDVRGGRAAEPHGGF